RHHTYENFALSKLAIIVVGFADDAYLFIETRSQSQKPPHKDPDRNGQRPAITLRPAYAPVSNRDCSRS
ncbi:hypothetical protein, partial [Lacticaseibacillus rhamnosus]